MARSEKRAQRNNLILSWQGASLMFPHLVFVEFQYTTCLLATAAEIMLKRKIVAFHAGRVPGVHTREPILTAAGAAERLFTPAGSGVQNQVRRPGKKEARSTNFLQQFHQLIKTTQKLHLLLLLLQFCIMQKKEEEEEG